MIVLPIKSEESYPWLLQKHYAKRIPQIMYAFGLYDDEHLVGVVTYGYQQAHLYVWESVAKSGQTKFWN